LQNDGAVGGGAIGHIDGSQYRQFRAAGHLDGQRAPQHRAGAVGVAHAGGVTAGRQLVENWTILPAFVVELKLVGPYPTRRLQDDDAVVAVAGGTVGDGDYR